MLDSKAISPGNADKIRRCNRVAGSVRLSDMFSNAACCRWEIAKRHHLASKEIVRFLPVEGRTIVIICLPGFPLTTLNQATFAGAHSWSEDHGNRLQVIQSAYSVPAWPPRDRRLPVSPSSLSSSWNYLNPRHKTQTSVRSIHGQAYETHYVPRADRSCRGSGRLVPGPRVGKRKRKSARPARRCACRATLAALAAFAGHFARFAAYRTTERRRVVLHPSAKRR
jgi:hypothetical protein